jgi:hypothetical protein
MALQIGQRYPTFRPGDHSGFKYGEANRLKVNITGSQKAGPSHRDPGAA